jgi:hypothetical protein
MPLDPGGASAAPACSAFEADVRGVCARWKKTLLGVETDGSIKTVMIQI